MLVNAIPRVPVAGTLEMDTHADTCVLGPNFVVLHYTGRECDVSPYTDVYESVKAVPIVSGALAWTDEETGLDYILVISEGLWMPDMVKASLINPNQLRAHGVTVQDNPFAGSMFISNESDEDAICIPMFAAGTNMSVATRTPTQAELDSCPHIILTSDNEWEPNDIRFPQVGSVHRDLVLDLESVPGEVYNVLGFSQRLVASCRVHSSLNSDASVVARDIPVVPTFQTEERRSDVSPEQLADRWMIGLDTAKQTLRRTTQRFLRSALLPLSRRYKADRMYLLPRLQGEWYTDTVEGRCKSKDGNRYGQVFANGSYFATFYPMDSKGKAGEALKTFCKEFGVPEKLRFDGSKEQTGKNTEFQRQIRKYDIQQHVSEPDMHNQSPAEGVVREIRRKWYRVMFKKHVPKVFWDYGMRWVCETMSRTHTRAQRIDGGIPLEKVTGETVDISNYLDFGFYDHVVYRDNAGLSEPKIGRWLGVSKNVGTMMTFYVLTQTGQVVSRSSVERVKEIDKQTDDMKSKLKTFDEEVKQRLKLDDLGTDGDKPDPHLWADLLDVDPDFRDEFFSVYQSEAIKDADDEPSPEFADIQFLNMELALPRDGEGPEFARVKKRLRDEDGKPIGRANDNLMLDTRVFEVEYLDGHTTTMSANAIAECMFAQVDQEGNRLLLLDEVMDHRSTKEAVKQADAFVVAPNGRRRRKETTKGWELLLKWKDGSETWVPLKDAKESFPLQVAEYSVQARIQEEPAFAWWVPHVFKKRSQIIAKVKSKYWQRTHKYGIRIPKTIKEALRIDAENGNTLWWDAIVLEMTNARVAFEVYDGELTQDGKPKGYKFVSTHMVFDVRLGENYRRKARLVADGHKTDAPTSITYSSVVSRDSVRIALTIAALNGLQVFVCDIQNAFLTAPCREKLYTVAGPEFGSDEGKVMILVRALYGLKSAGATFRAFLGEHIYNLGFRSSQADPDVWLRPACKPCGEKYYEYVLCYVDDVLAISVSPEGIMKSIQEKFKLKGDKYGPPTDYLGAQLSVMTNANGTECWTQSSDRYVEESVKNVEDFLKSKGRSLPAARVRTPIRSGYKPELDETPELAAEGHSYYQELIGILRWAVELGRLDILLEVSLMSTYLAAPREGHLEQVFHIFGYLKKVPRRRIAFDPDYPIIDESRFRQYDWSDFYQDAEEAIPPDAPEPLGKPVSLHCFVDADLAGNVVTRRSQTGILIFLNRAPVVWHSKKQNTVESSTFGSEIVALKNAIELIKSLRYKLRMFGVPIIGPADIFCDNEAVTTNCTTPESTIKKKHHSIAYHYNREAVASKTVRIAKEDSDTNLADLFTKLLIEERRNFLIDRFMY